MKRNFKLARLVPAGLVAATVASTAYMPATSLALSSTSNLFCTGLPTKATTITTSLSSLVDKVTQAWSQQDSKLLADQQAVDQAAATGRATADSKRNADFAKLTAKATTDAEKQAVSIYVAAITNAITARRNAYDDAQATFRSGIKDAIVSRRTTVTDQFTVFKDAVSSALSTAEAACTADPSNGSAIRATLVASLLTARTTFQDERQGDITIRLRVQQLAATRNTAFKTADQTFEATATAARQALRQAFAQSGGTV